jgi:hypothetical protein
MYISLAIPYRKYAGAGGNDFNAGGQVSRLLSPIVPPDILCVGLKKYMRHYEDDAKKRGIARPPAYEAIHAPPLCISP